MIRVKPKYYSEFECIKGDCPMTCCSGWEIVVDNDALERYNNISGRPGNISEPFEGANIKAKILGALIVDDDGDRIFTTCQGRCPFLNFSGLCDIHASLGEEYLCNTCRRFPRFSAQYGMKSEEGLSASCPVAAELILSTEIDDSFFVTTVDAERVDAINDIDPDEYMLLLAQRTKLLNILKSLNVSNESAYSEIVKAIFPDKSFSKEIFPRIKRDAVYVCGKLESIGSEWDEVKGRIEDVLWALDDNVGDIAADKTFISYTAADKILAYYLYRYFLDELTHPLHAAPTGHYRIALCATLIIGARIQGLKETPARAMYMTARELEHSQLNLDIIENEFLQNF